MLRDFKNMHGDWYLVEDIVHETDLSGKNLVSLSPAVSYLLGKKGINYSILEDYYEEESLLPDQGMYFTEQLSVMDELDHFLRKNLRADIPKNLGLVRAHYFRVKCLMDSLVLVSRAVIKFLEAVRPDSVTYCGRDGAYMEGASLYRPFPEQGKIVSGLIEEISKQRGVAFSRWVSGGGVPKRLEQRHFKFPGICSFRCAARSIFYFFRFRKFMKVLPSRVKKRLNVMSLHAGCYAIDRFIAETIRNRGKVFLKTGPESIFSVHGLFHEVCLDLSVPYKIKGQDDIKASCGAAAERFPLETKITGWLNEQCGADVSRFFIPYMRDLIGDVFYRNLSEMTVLERFIEEEKIDYVVARSSSEKDSISSILAAAKKGKRVCFQHSCSVADGGRDLISEMDHFDIYFSINSSEEKRLKEALNYGYLSGCSVFQDAGQLEAVKRKWARKRRDDGPVMYIPTKLFLGFRGINGYLYPITWYYEFQKRLVDHFFSKKNTRFIFKYAPGQEWSRMSIVRYILDHGKSNISIEEKRVSECLGGLNRVILDYPSTSFHEAAVAGLPVMSLYSPCVEVGERGKRLFGRSLQKFGSFSEAIAKVEDFLEAPAEDYIVDIPFRRDRAFNALAAMKNRKI